LNPGEASSAVVDRFVGSNNQTIDVQAIDVRNVREADESGQRTSEFTQVKVRLPDNLSVGTCTVFIRAHGRSSNLGTIRIAP